MNRKYLAAIIYVIMMVVVNGFIVFTCGAVAYRFIIIAGSGLGLRVPTLLLGWPLLFLFLTLTYIRWGGGFVDHLLRKWTGLGEAGVAIEKNTNPKEPSRNGADC